MKLRVPGVEFGREIEHFPLSLGRQVGREIEVEDRSPLRAEGCGLISRGQESRAPVARSTFTPLRILQDDECGEALILRAKPIGNPSPRAGKARSDHARVHLIHRWSMRGRFSKTSLDQCEVIDMSREVGEPVANPRAALSVLLEPKRRLHQRSRTAEEDVDRRPRPLAVVSSQLRLGVEGVHSAGAPFHEQPDHLASLGRKVRRLRGERAEGSFVRRQQPIPAK